MLSLGDRHLNCNESRHAWFRRECIEHQTIRGKNQNVHILFVGDMALDIRTKIADVNVS